MIRALVAAASVAVAIPLVAPPSAHAADASGGIQTLQGALILDPVSCPKGKPSGSYFVVTGNGRAYTNPSSSCAHGAITLLPPGTTGLLLGRFLADPVPTFYGHGNSRSTGITAYAQWAGHAIGMATSPFDVQDAPSGPIAFSPPSALVQGRTLTLDLRSLEVTFDGRPDSTCASEYGQGCWLEGNKSVTGTFDSSTKRFSVSWASGQNFSGAGTAGVAFHLEGHLAGGAVDATVAPPPAPPAPTGGSNSNAPASGASTASAPATDSATSGSAGGASLTPTAQRSIANRPGLFGSIGRGTAASDRSATSTGAGAEPSGATVVMAPGGGQTAPTVPVEALGAAAVVGVAGALVRVRRRSAAA